MLLLASCSVRLHYLFRAIKTLSHRLGRPCYFAQLLLLYFSAPFRPVENVGNYIVYHYRRECHTHLQSDCLFLLLLLPESVVPVSSVCQFRLFENRNIQKCLQLTTPFVTSPTRLRNFRPLLEEIEIKAGERDWFRDAERVLAVVVVDVTMCIRQRTCVCRSDVEVAGYRPCLSVREGYLLVPSSIDPSPL